MIPIDVMSAWGARLRAAWDRLWGVERSLLRSAGFLLALRIIEKACGVIIAIALFRLLDISQVGTYGFVQSIVVLCAVFALPEFQNTLSQCVARGFLGTYRRVVPISLAWSVAGSVSIAAVGGWYNWLGETELAEALWLAALLFPLSQGLNHWKGVLQGEGAFGALSVAEATTAILRVVLITGALLIFPGSIVFPLLAFFGVPAAQNVLQTLKCLRRIPSGAPSEDGAVAYGLRVNRLAGLSMAVNQVDRLLIFGFLSPPLLALYMAAEKFAELLNGIIQDLSVLLVRKFSTVKSYTRQLDDILKLLSAGAGLCILAFVFFFLPKVVIVAFGDDYGDAIIYAQILCGIVAFRNITTLRFRFIRSRLDVATYRRVAIVGSVVKILGSFLLIPLLGLGGAVLSVLFHRISMELIVSHAIRRIYLKE